MGERRNPRPPRSFQRNEVDARRYQRHGVLYMVAIYAVLAAAMVGVVPVVIMSPVVAVCYVRGALLTHELMHVRRPGQVPWILRMMMLFDTPLGLGYREYQDVHLRHHRWTATVEDPEFFQIHGGRIRALGAAMVGSELAAMHWVISRGIGPRLRAEAGLRGVLMLTLLVLEPAVFLSYWIVIRLTIGISNFVFHHVLHYRRREYGTFALHLPGPLDALLRGLVGASLAAVLSEHDAHHAWPGVKAERLRGLLQAYPGTTTHP